VPAKSSGKPREGKPSPLPRSIEADAVRQANAIFERAKRQTVAAVNRLLKAQGAPAEATKQLQRELANIVSSDELSAWATEHVGRLSVLVQRNVAQQIGGTVAIQSQVPAALRARIVRTVISTMRSIPQSVARRASPVLRTALEQGLRGEDIAAELSESLGISERQARKTAVGGVLRANAEITRERHQSAGITNYRWRSSPDALTRAWHKKLNNTIQSYDSPPLGGGGGPKDHGNPGSADTCRCQAIPILPTNLGSKR